MKKLLIAISVVIMMAFIASSCQTSSKCAAYGESYKYQKEVKY